MLLGDFDCKVDVKGRILFPVGLMKQLPSTAQDKFVITRGFGKYLILYPVNIWEIISKEVNQLNLYKQKERNVVRYLSRGASHLTLDSSNRLLLPKPLIEYANIKKEIKLSPLANQIEIWSKDIYDEMISVEPEDFSVMVEEVMGKININKPNDDK